MRGISFAFVAFSAHSLVQQQHRASGLSIQKQQYERSLRLSSSNVQDVRWTLPKDGYKDGSLGREDEEENTRLALLDSRNAPCVSITVEELQAKWIDICIEQSRPKDMDMFCLRSVLPLLLREDTIVHFINKTAEEADSNQIYVTEQELKRLWTEASTSALGKAVDKFSVEEALLLLTDDDDDALLDSAPEEDQDDGLVISSSSEEDGSLLIEDKREYYVTRQELERLWGERAAVPWGLPAREFDEKLSLLLLIDDDEGDDDGEYSSSIDRGDTVDPISSPITYDPPYPVDADAGLNSVSDVEEINSAVLEMHQFLDDPSYVRPAWRKDRHILTPDIDTQRFMGDIMMSNTYMTQRIPANWNDPEQEDMSEYYLASGSMALPGEPETDFNEKISIWDALSLPADGVWAPLPTVNAAAAASPRAREAAPKPDWASVDMSTLDPLTDVSLAAPLSRQEQEEAAATLSDNVLASATRADGSVDVAAFLEDFSRINFPPEQEEEEEEGEDTVGIYQTPEAPRNSPKWVTPPEWLSRPDFRLHAGFDEWERYDVNEFFGADEAPWEEDLHYLRAVQHLSRVTDEYLEDHAAVSRRIDDYKFWQRQLQHGLTGHGEVDAKTGRLQEEIPIYLTPDANRGVEYGDEVIEMKSKMTLHVAMPRPAELFAEDRFEHNDEFETMNKIGTVRVQYDWQPDASLLPYKIEADVAAKLAPVIRFVNHAAKLRSTKDGVVIFDYLGQMRHLIGIRDFMLRIAKDCYPQIKVRPFAFRPLFPSFSRPLTPGLPPDLSTRAGPAPGI